MALSTVLKTSLLPILCPPGLAAMQPGDQVRLTLDTQSVPGLPDTILGIIQTPVAEIPMLDGSGCRVTGVQYEIEYESDDLDDALEALRSDDILSMACVSCCQSLREDLDTEISNRQAAIAAEANARQLADATLVSHNVDQSLSSEHATIGRTNIAALAQAFSVGRLLVWFPYASKWVLLDLMPAGSTVTLGGDSYGSAYDLPLWFSNEGDYEFAVYASESVEGRSNVWCIHDPFDTAHPYTMAEDMDCREVSPWESGFTQKFSAGNWETIDPPATASAMNNSWCVLFNADQQKFQRMVIIGDPGDERVGFAAIP